MTPDIGDYEYIGEVPSVCDNDSQCETGETNAKRKNKKGEKSKKLLIFKVRDNIMSRNKTIIISILLSVVSVGLAYFWFGRLVEGGREDGLEIKNFEDCVRAPLSSIATSYPRQCRTVDGRLFKEERADIRPPQSPDLGICKNNCGDGTCQEITCMGTGCSCPETDDNCPADCRK